MLAAVANIHPRGCFTELLLLAVYRLAKDTAYKPYHQNGEGGHQKQGFPLYLSLRLQVTGG